VAIVIYVITILVALFAVGAHAEPQTRTYYDDRGREIGRSEQRGNALIYLNEKGQRTGRSEQRDDGLIIYFDNRGQRIGTSKERSR
jgi:hypothetical protein